MHARRKIAAKACWAKDYRSTLHGCFPNISTSICKERIILTSKLYSRLALKLLSEYFWKNPCGLITYTFWIVAVNKICKSGAKQITIVCAFVQIALETVLYNTHNNMKIYHQGKTIKILTFNLFRTSFTAAHFSERRSMMAVNPFFRSSGL